MTSAGALTAVVADDEQLARDELCYLLGQAGVTVIGQAANGVDALAAIDEQRPDLVFLDVQMPGLNGFEVARRLLESPNRAPALVFVTAFYQHAVEAFEVNAVDYLLKPVDAGRLEQADRLQLRCRRTVAAEPPLRGPQAEAGGERGDEDQGGGAIEHGGFPVWRAGARRSRTRCGSGRMIVVPAAIIRARLQRAPP